VSSNDLGRGVVMLAIAAAYYLLGTSIPQSALDDAVGPRGLPRAYAIVLAALAVVTIARGARLRQGYGGQAESRAGTAKPKPASSARSWRFIGLALIGVAYLAVVPWLGYLVSIALLIAGTTWYQGGSISRSALVVAASGAVFLWLLFVVLLGIPQPSGAWSAIF
jgi:hypothetical protein